MIIILLKTDETDNVLHPGNVGENTPTIEEGVDCRVNGANRKKKLRRTIDDFMCNDTQYIRIGEVYLQITPSDEMRQISQSKYYKLRKEADNDAIQ